LIAFAKEQVHGRQNARNPTPAIPGIGFGNGAKLREVYLFSSRAWPAPYSPCSTNIRLKRCATSNPSFR
jgi:hypothetical protein